MANYENTGRTVQNQFFRKILSFIKFYLLYNVISNVRHSDHRNFY